MNLSFVQILQRSLETESLVRVYRRRAPTDPIVGYVAAVNDELLAIYTVEANVRFDGVAVIRTCDISEVRTRGADENFIKRALAARGLDPPATQIDISSWKSVIQSLQDDSPIANIQNKFELDDPDDDLCDQDYGTVVKILDDSIIVRPIDIGGVWKKYKKEISLNALLRVDSGGIFERMLGELAREPETESRS